MTLLPVHIIAGSIGLMSGAVALYARKGGRVHRKSGMIFVYAMLVMSALGAGIAAVEHRGLGGEMISPQKSSVIAGLLTFYLVSTALLTVQPWANESRWINGVSMIVALIVACLSVKFALGALSSATGKVGEDPPAPILVFGSVALLAAVGDLRVLARGIKGSRRIARHLWRMCFAMFIAALSFFLGQAKIFPKPIRIIPLLALPVVAVLLLMFYWLVRMWLVKRYPRRGPRLMLRRADKPRDDTADYKAASSIS